MRRTRSLRRSLGIVLGLTVTMGVLSIGWQGTAWGACGTAPDISLSASAAPGPEGHVVYTFGVTNFGPLCAHGVKLHADLGAGFVSFSSADEWSCPSPPGSTSVDCFLQTDLEEGSTSFISIEAVAPNPTKVTAAGFASASGTVDPDPTNNRAWAAFGTDVRTDPQGPKAQTTTIVRPDQAGLSAQEVSPNSRLGSGVPAPCEPKCVEDLESIFVTPPTDPSQFPGVHIAVVLGVKSNRTDTSIPVYRFDHDRGRWLGPLPSCFGGGPVQPNVGCVQSVVIEKGRATITVWTSHNGHIRG